MPGLTMQKKSMSPILHTHGSGSQIARVRLNLVLSRLCSFTVICFPVYASCSSSPSCLFGFLFQSRGWTTLTLHGLSVDFLLRLTVTFRVKTDCCVASHE